MNFTSKALPTTIEEDALHRQGYHYVAGIDEAGRGALMGPVVAAAVIMPETIDGKWVRLVNDSKQVTPVLREQLYTEITTHAVSYGAGYSSNEVIDSVGIAKATRIAMVAAVHQLAMKPDYIIVDHFRIPELVIPHHGITHGDSLCFSIACASIIAKVTRDRMVQQLAEQYPDYCFTSNKGYGTAEHLDCLRRFGPCPVHRRSFKPLRQELLS